MRGYFRPKLKALHIKAEFEPRLHPPTLHHSAVPTPGPPTARIQPKAVRPSESVCGGGRVPDRALRDRGWQHRAIVGHSQIHLHVPQAPQRSHGAPRLKSVQNHGPRAEVGAIRGQATGRIPEHNRRQLHRVIFAAQRRGLIENFVQYAT